MGEKKFFDNSRIINHYILDANNLDILKDTTFLSNIANNKGEWNEFRCNNYFDKLV